MVGAVVAVSDPELHTHIHRYIFSIKKFFFSKGIPLWITLIVYKTYQRVTERMGQPGKVELKVEQTVEDKKTTDVESQSPMLNQTEPKE